MASGTVLGFTSAMPVIAAVEVSPTRANATDLQTIIPHELAAATGSSTCETGWEYS